MGTDGLFDNLYDTDILDKCIQPRISPIHGGLGDVQGAADCLAVHAEVYGYDDNYVSPFTKSAVAHGKKLKRYTGGKSDDITVLVAQVKTK